MTHILPGGMTEPVILSLRKIPPGSTKRKRDVEDQRIHSHRHDLRPLRAFCARGGLRGGRRRAGRRRAHLGSSDGGRCGFQRRPDQDRGGRGGLRDRRAMTAAAPRLAGFAVALAVLFGIGALAGGVFDPAPPNASPQRPAAARQAMAGMAQTDQDGAGGSAVKMGVRGLAVSAEGLRMVVDTPVFEPGRTRELRFRVLDDRERALRDYDVQHTKRMHLIVVRRDLSGFQHLHPRLAADGTWRVPLRLDAAGSYRVFADFSHDDTPVTLGSDLTVDGRFSARQLPAPRLETAAGDYQVRLVAAKAAPGR